MSVQSGLWFFDGRPVDNDFLLRARDAFADFKRDGISDFVHGPISMIYSPFHTTKESRLERQPCVSSRGFVVMWDGRLDNREELIVELGDHLTSNQTDVDIVVEAYGRWGTDCFSKFKGDWALSIWHPIEKSLILARDYLAVRHLYYHITQDKITWCTHLSPIVLLAATKFTLSDEYIAGYLVAFPAAHLTPYEEIRAVPPGKFVKIHNRKATILSFWSFEPRKKLRYKADAEYEEHFRHVFRQSVSRRLRSDSPILADLSGGFDSSSIVCMADEIRARGHGQASQLHTISYYDPTEPDGDDFSYFTKVEERRGRTGYRVNLAQFGTPFTLEYLDFTPTPGLQSAEELRLERKKILQETGCRVSLSGTGGDELNGQAAEFRTQIADLMLRLRVPELAKQLKAWSLLTRRPLVHLLLQTMIQLFPTAFRIHLTKKAKLECWIDHKFGRRCRLSRQRLGVVEGQRFWLPSDRDCAETLASLANQMACQRPSIEEKRYPYLDQDFVEFLISIPQDQLLRPGERRSLMRRALADLLPRDVLSRRTKAGAGRCYIVMMEKVWPTLTAILESPLSARLGFINSAPLREALRDLKSGNVPSSVVLLMRALSLELWLRDTIQRGVISDPSDGLLPQIAHWTESRSQQL